MAPDPAPVGEVRLRLALEAADLGSFIWYPDDDHSEPDDRMLALFGLRSAEELNLENALTDLIHPDDRDRYGAAVGRALDPNGTGRLFEEIRVRHPDGAERWLAVSGRVAFAGDPPRAHYMAGVAADVTQRRSADIDAARLASLVSTSQDAIVMVGLDDRFESWNDAATRLFGFTAEEAIGESYRIIVPDDRLHEPEQILAERHLARATPAFDTVRRHKDGRLIEVSIAVTPIFDAAGALVGSSAVLRDITARKQEERDRRETAERDAFLVDLSDTIRPLADPGAIQAEATRLLGEHLGADRVFYAQILEDGAEIVLDGGYHASDLPPIEGRFPLEGIGPGLLSDMRERRTVVIPDITAHPEISPPSEPPVEVEVEMRAAVGVPLVKGGRWVASLSTQHREPRAFTPEEVALIEETADRTWSALERARAEEALRRREGQLRAIYDGTHEYMGLLTPGGILLDCNRASLEFAGVPKDDVVGRLFWETPWWAGTESAAETCRRAVATAATGETVHGEIDLRRPTGETLTIDYAFHPVVDRRGRVVLIVPEGRDITDRKRSEEALRASEERFRSIANASPNMVWTADPTGIITFFNDRWAEYSGIDRSRDPREWQWDVVHPDDRGRARAAWEAAVATAGEFEVEMRNRRHDGAHRWFLSRATPQRTRSGTVVQWLGSATDIDEQKRLESRLRDSESAERAARVRAEFLSEAVGELEALQGVDGRARRLLDLLVPRVATSAVMRIAGERDTDEFRAGDSDPQAVVEIPLGGGTGSVMRLGRATAWEPSELSFLGEIGQRAGLLLENARLRDEEQRVALRLQGALLPNAVLAHPSVSIDSRYEAASDAMVVGGDWYDSFTLDGGRIGIAVGDVVGHGLDAAAAMGRMRIALATIAAEVDGPGALLSRLDEFARGPNGAEFTTVCYGVLDPSTSEFRYASAGHPPILTMTPEGETEWLDGGRSAPLGYEPGVDRPEASVRLEPGSLLVLYSDGLIERRGESLSVGLERLEAAARAQVGESVWDVCNRLMEAMGVADERGDDVVVMAVRVAPSAERFHRRFAARSSELAPLRVAIRDWMRDRSVPAAIGNDLLIGIGEATSNAVEHAYRNGEVGDIVVEVAEEEPGAVRVRIRDFGIWREDLERDPLRGRGTRIMESAADEFTRRTGHEGTTVTFRVRFGSEMAV